MLKGKKSFATFPQKREHFSIFNKTQAKRFSNSVETFLKICYNIYQ